MALVATAMLVAPASALAGDFPVTTTDDSGPGSLREAIAGANSDPDATSTIPISATGTILLESSLPDITQPVTIVGPASDQLTVRRFSGGDYRIFDFDVVGGDVAISGLTVANGKPATGSGGGIFFQTIIDNLTLTDVVVRGNSASGGGGVSMISGFPGTEPLGSLTLNDSSISANEAPGGLGGGIYALGHLSLNNTAVTGNRSSGNGAGVVLASAMATLTGVESEVSDNISASSAGGILNIGKASLNNSEISGNSALGGGARGGGIYTTGSLSLGTSTVSDNDAAVGGGIFNAGKLILTGSTLTGNRVIGIGPLGAGAGLYNASGTAAIIDATFAGNTADGSGGGIYNGAGLGANAITLAGNLAKSGGGSFNGNGAVFTVANSLWAGNVALTGPDCAADDGDPYASAGHNLISAIDPLLCGGFGPDDLTNLDPLVDPLSDNGGPTQTVRLLAGSPAVGAGDPGTPGTAFPACPATDQRGVPRGGTTGPCDIGAFELQPPPPQTGGEQITPLITPPPTTAPRTGRRAKALKRCKSVKKPAKRRKCRRRAHRLPV